MQVKKKYEVPSAISSFSPNDLLKQLKDMNVESRKQALLEIQKRQVDTKEIRAALYEATRDQFSIIRQLAIETLSFLGSTDQLMASLFLRALRDQERAVREAAMLAFSRHGEAFTLEVF